MINYALTEKKSSLNIPVIYLEQLPPENIHSFINDERTVKHWWPIHDLYLPLRYFSNNNRLRFCLIEMPLGNIQTGYMNTSYLGFKYLTSIKLHITRSNTKINFSISKSKWTFYNFHFIMILHNYFSNIYPSITSHSALFNIRIRSFKFCMKQFCSIYNYMFHLNSSTRTILKDHLSTSTGDSAQKSRTCLAIPFI